ncbi:CLUMA_CG012547, isoform A [Clunio marinus]|uniref:CLUMA_CG012547, isoform A n=1 Tax=Clunio marinus TaxID=568069 RepID=A0A1J1II44_9DIPT|nr:CLUMA_CG012547, isoform A [Clunio marinus]
MVLGVTEQQNKKPTKYCMKKYESKYENSEKTKRRSKVELPLVATDTTYLNRDFESAFIL